jgi:hypothetical protein
VVAFTFLLAALATWRITHLVVEDTVPVVARPRQWVMDRWPDGNLTYVLHCTYCSSVWVGAAVTAGVDLLTKTPVPAPVLYAAGLSILTAFAETVVDWLDRYGVGG